MSALQEYSEPEGDFETEQTMLWSDTMDLFLDRNTTAHTVWTDLGMFAIVAGVRSDIQSANYYQVANVVDNGRLRLSTQLYAEVPITFDMIDGKVIFNHDGYTDQDRYKFCKLIRVILRGTEFTQLTSQLATRMCEEYYIENYQVFMNSNDIYRQYPGMLAWRDQLRQPDGTVEPK